MFSGSVFSSIANAPMPASAQNSWLNVFSQLLIPEFLQEQFSRDQKPFGWIMLYRPVYRQ